MLTWAFGFLAISLVAGFFGFTGIASGARKISQILFAVCFLIFLGLVLLVLLAGAVF